MDMDAQTFGEKIKQARLTKGYSLKYVGNIIGYSPSLLSKVEQNQRKAPTRIVEPLANLLGLEYEVLSIKYISEQIFYAVKNINYAGEILEIVQKRLMKEGKGTQYVKNKREIISIIQSCFLNKPIKNAWLFGSFARNTIVSFDSDIDILVEFKKSSKISLFDIVDIKNELSEKTGRAIDLVELGTELKSYRSQIHSDKVLIYGKEEQTK